MKPNVRFKFRQYVAGDTPNSARAMANLTALCKTHLEGCHEIEVVDVFKEPLRALADGIMMTPTLIVLEPLPVRRIVGSLSHLAIILQTLDLGAAE